MKIDKTKPRHWLYLVLFTVNVCIGILVRLLLGERSNDLVLYGHKLNGNLRALYDHISNERCGSLKIHYLTMDPAYYRCLREQRETVLNGLKLTHMISACRASCLVTDHGLHSLILLAKFSKMRLVDVWHGIPFKGFDSDDFSSMRNYSAILVSSPSMRDIYISRFGFTKDQVQVTGYGRTDRLYKGQYDRAKLLDKYRELPADEAIVMFAPTWTHGYSRRRELPFGTDLQGFLSDITPLLDRINCYLVVRAHLNTRSTWSTKSPRIKFLGMDRYPQTEELLFLTDALICDWSSIAFDYLVVRRPTIFLECDAPFEKGFTYGPEYRFGPVVNNLDELRRALLLYLRDPRRYVEDYGQKMKAVSREVYGDYLDGLANQRCVKEIVSIGTQAGSSNSHLVG